MRSRHRSRRTARKATPDASLHCLQLQAHSEQKVADMEALQQRFKAIVKKKDGSIAAMREQLAACQSRQGELLSELEQQKQQLLSLT